MPHNRIRGHLTLLGADDLAPTPVPRPTSTLPNGRIIPRIARGVYWAPVTVGGAYACFAVTSTGEVAAWELCSLTASPDAFDDAEHSVRARLERADPMRLTIVEGAGLGGAERRAKGCKKGTGQGRMVVVRGVGR